MKQNFITALIFAIALISCKTGEKGTKQNLNEHNSRNSLDWAGTYRDTLPCADCEGILTEIVLNSDLSYKMGTSYLGKNGKVFRSEGKFSWSNDGSTITLNAIDATKESNKYKVGENKLIKLDRNGKVITGNLADKYIITKQMEIITDRYWKLVQLHGRQIETPEGEREAFLFLSTAENRVFGNAGCNSVNGSHELAPMKRLRFSKMATTLMACPNMETEKEFLDVLENTDSYFLKGDTLELFRARMAPLARFENVFLK